MIITLIHRTVLILFAVFACYRLALVFSPTVMLATWGAATAIACSAGALLLWTSTIGQVTWKNRVAGYLIPWGTRLNQGKLWPIPVISWFVWMAIAVATICLFRPPANEPNSSSTLARTLLLFAWIVDASALLYVLGTICQRFSFKSSSSRSLLKIAGVISAMLVVSMILHLTGSTYSALSIAGGPPSVLGAFYGLYLIAILTFGRYARWN